MTRSAFVVGARPPWAHPKYRPDIDGLRAIAVLSVVVFHAFPHALRGGFIGVDVFFVISGYLISTILFENLDSRSFSFAEFYARRIKRIFPALLLVLTACFAFGWFVLLADEFKQLGRHMAAGAGFVSNLVLWQEIGYFDSEADLKPLLHLWSLGIEEQFYMVWPLLLWLMWTLKLRPLAASSVLELVSFGLSAWGVHRDASATFYAPYTRFWELLCGSMLAALPQRARGVGPCNTCSLLGLAMLAFGLGRIHQGLSFPGPWALVPVLGATLIIAAGPEAWGNRVILSQRWLTWFGLISFPLYLWHWPLLVFARILEGQRPGVGLRCGALLAAVALAWWTYRWVEQPIRKGSVGMRRTVLILSVLMAFVGGVGLAVQASGGVPARSVARVNDVFDYGKHWEGWQVCHLVDAPDPNNGGCRVLRDDKPVDVMVVGDSHAGHLASGLRDRFDGRAENVAVLLHAGCFPVFSMPGVPQANFSCPGDLIDKALQLALTTSSVKVVVLSGYPALQIQKSRWHEPSQQTPEQEAANLKALDAAMTQTLSALVAAHKKVVFVLDNPELLADPKSCVTRLFEPHCHLDVPRDGYLKRNQAFLALIQASRRAFPSVTFTNTADAFCDATQCHASKDGVLWYASQDHLTPEGSRHLMKTIGAQLTSP